VPYLIMLGVTVAAALVGLADWIRLRPSLRSGGRPMPILVRCMEIAFVVVGYIAVRVLEGPKGPWTPARRCPPGSQRACSREHSGRS
jgi:hypothetical protein